MEARSNPIINGQVIHLRPSGLTVIRRTSDTQMRVMRTGDPKRDAILSDPTILESVQTVVRKRGVPEEDVPDVVQDVFEAACDDASLPLDDKEHARMYLCGCARYKSIDHARGRKRQSKRLSDTAPDGLPSPGHSLEDHVLAREILAEGQKRFPFTHKWFERFVMGEETHAEIAADPRVTADHVRHEVSRIRQSLRAFALAGIALFISALALRAWNPFRHPTGGTIAKTVTPAPQPLPAPTAPKAPPAPPPEAVALRERAQQECSAGHWNECSTDLDRAFALDPQGESPETRSLRNRASHELDFFEAKPKRQ
jgi:DNA-directed RNA polymerase specialized sigma24 family protein